MISMHNAGAQTGCHIFSAGNIKTFPWPTSELCDKAAYIYRKLEVISETFLHSDEHLCKLSH